MRGENVLLCKINKNEQTGYSVSTVCALCVMLPFSVQLPDESCVLAMTLEVRNILTL